MSNAVVDAAREALEVIMRSTLRALASNQMLDSALKYDFAITTLKAAISPEIQIAGGTSS
jgi:hypothetical protein